MLNWIVLMVQVCSETVLTLPKRMIAAVETRTRVQQPFFRALSRARTIWAHPRLFDARSQFSSQGFGALFGSARGLGLWGGQGLAIQGHLGQGRNRRLGAHCWRRARFALSSGSFANSGASGRT